MSRRIRIHEYHPSNPKIAIIVGGKYRYTTQWYSRCSDARDWFLANDATSEERLKSCSHPARSWRQYVRAVKEGR